MDRVKVVIFIKQTGDITVPLSSFSAILKFLQRVKKHILQMSISYLGDESYDRDRKEGD
jgi:hypothetical protein